MTVKRHCLAPSPLLEAPLLPAPEAFFRGAVTCGRGGTGRRAALRSLWPKGRGSSSLLDRTSIEHRRVLVANRTRTTPACKRSRSEEHTSELQSANISYAVFCLKKKKTNK